MNGMSDRMALLAGLRTGGQRNATNQDTQSQSIQDAQIQLYQNQQQQLIQQQQAYYLAAMQSGQVTPSQAQMFALQQSQMEMQMQQLQLAQLLLQQQQQAAQLQQQQQQASADTDRGLKMQQSMDNMEGNPYTRNSALRNLRQASKPRAVSTGQDSGRSLDWQAERLRFTSPPPADTPTSVTSPAQSERPASIDTKAAQHHRKTSSLASTQSNAVSDAGSVYSPNRGPTLVLSKPGEECSDDEDEGHDVPSGPTSPSLAASMRAMSFTAAANAMNLGKEGEDANKPAEADLLKQKKKSKRHTVILSSSLPHAIDGNQGIEAAEIVTSSSDDSSSSGSSSPTSEKSDIASFDSESLPSAATSATSGVPSSPTDSTGSNKENAEDKKESVKQSGRRVVTMPLKSAALNPAASIFSPAGLPAAKQHAERYPSGLSLSSNPSSVVSTPTQLRMFSAPPPSSAMPSGFNTPSSNAVIVIRQPKGVPKEDELASKNFSAMLRRKAVGALRVAASSGGRISPVASPVNAQFPAEVKSNRLSSPPLGSGTFANFGAELAQRALKRRSQQLTPSQASFSDLGY